VCEDNEKKKEDIRLVDKKAKNATLTKYFSEMKRNKHKEIGERCSMGKGGCTLDGGWFVR
jgi:hypothetical protein